MRHDAHYVEELAEHRPTPVGRLISLDRLERNPEQPRVEIGDLTELTASIQEKGVLEPLLVRPSRLTGRWMIIAGERRWRAARAAGLREVPCIEMDVDDQAVAEIALIENMQRKDLTPWEEADGLLALTDRFGYTHEDVARKVGKSRSSVTESISIASAPEGVRELCRRADITSKSVLLLIVRQPNEEAMKSFIEQVAGRNLTRDEARDARRTKFGGRRRVPPYTYRYAAPGKEFRVEVKFRKANVDRDELLTTLRSIVRALEDEEARGASDNVKGVD
jgi:ParB family chromosome partitioning protein